MKPDEKELSRFAFLEKTAKDLGAIDAKAISASQVFVENRVPLKCRTGCIGYGKKLTCPPFVPTANEFRKILSEYRYVLLVKFSSPALPSRISSALSTGTGSIRMPLLRRRKRLIPSGKNTWARISGYCLPCWSWRRRRSMPAIHWHWH
jgi:predicted metal-binding protein